jgi:hypothetical protein
MERKPKVDSQDLQAETLLRKAASKYMLETHMFANPFDPRRGVRFTPHEVKALWRELLALGRSLQRIRPRS